MGLSSTFHNQDFGDLFLTWSVEAQEIKSSTITVKYRYF